MVTSSGMSAILCGLLTHLQAGDHVLCSSEIYGVTGSLLEKELSRLGIEFSFADFSQLDQVTESIHWEPLKLGLLNGGRKHLS